MIQSEDLGSRTGGGGRPGGTPAPAQRLEFRCLQRAAPLLSRLSFVAGVCLFGSTGCSLRIQVPKYAVSIKPPAGHLIAGVSRVDITPPAGYPMGGHSLGGRFSRGHWGRLYARAFYFRDAEGNSVTLVSADLFAVPAGLQEDVASLANRGFPADGSTLMPEERQRARHAGVLGPCPVVRAHSDIGRHNLVVAATHTHQAPGNYLSSSFFNGFASQYPGFAREQFDFLSLRIACAVALAADDAGAHSGDPVTLTWSEKRNVEGLARNRAVSSLKRNGPTVMKEILKLGPSSHPGCEAPASDLSDGCLRMRAIDATLTKLTISRGAGSVGALVFFAMHPTALSDHVSVNSPDLTGFAMTRVEEEESVAGRHGFVAGFFNGAEGDVSPRWGRQDSGDALRLAGKLAANAMATTTVTVDGPGARVSAARASRKQTAFCGGTRPVMGIATLGGAEDGRSFAFDLGWRAPERGANRKKKSVLSRVWNRIRHWTAYREMKAQEPKVPGLDFRDLPGSGVTGLIAPPEGYPSEVPASLVRVGSRTIAAVPFEMTTAAGMSLKTSLAAQGVANPIVVGLANEYVSYLVTEEEYDEQDYEGASTLYGRFSLKCLAALLAPASVRPETNVPPRTFSAGGPPVLDAALGPAFWGSNGQFQDASLESPFLPEGRGQERLPRFEWEHCNEDDAVELLTLKSGAWTVDRVESSGEVLVELAEGREGPDQNGHLHHRRWAAVWLTGKDEDSAASHMFRVHPRVYEGQLPGQCAPAPICSAAFRLADVDAGRPGTIPAGACPP
ncbi:MAG: neutral/alkaline non-lysosomal ceramidase N-terminal domain-containing protein [Acidobacteria bacterium]|nr:neutral/alkaline non-lysosomal ceramidase N-terminal domain-containing protein [Acidobacteriota bacterium]